MCSNKRIKKPLGIWLYGLAGSGKTYASDFLQGVADRAFILDGDEVRKYVSPELRYSEKDRKTQLERMLGISLIVLKNGFFPIVSTVTMTSEILQTCQKKKIHVIRIERPFDQLKEVRDLYDGRSDVVGADLKLKILKTKILKNDGTLTFNKTLVDYVNTFTN